MAANVVCVACVTEAESFLCLLDVKNLYKSIVTDLILNCGPRAVISGCCFK